MRTIMRFLASLVLVVVVLAGAGWFFRDDILRIINGEPERVEPPAREASATIADGAVAKLERLRTEGEVVRLSEAEIASLIQYRWSGWIPTVLNDPTVALSADTMRLAGRVPTAVLPTVPELERVRSFLPDTVGVEVTGQLEPLTPGRAAFEVAAIEVERLPIPERFYLPMLERLGRRDEPGLGPTAIPLILPDGVGSATVEEGYLVLTPGT